MSSALQKTLLCFTREDPCCCLQVATSTWGWEMLPGPLHARSILPECKGQGWCLIDFFLLDFAVDCFSVWGFFLLHLCKEFLPRLSEARCCWVWCHCYQGCYSEPEVTQPSSPGCPWGQCSTAEMILVTWLGRLCRSLGGCDVIRTLLGKVTMLGICEKSWEKKNCWRNQFLVQN